MARVMTFSTKFPKGHPKEGQPTFFVEKIINSLDIYDHKKMTLMDHYSDEINETEDEFMSGSCNPVFPHGCKYHTIRSGSRWKPGMIFSPRVWSGKPYNTPQIQFAPDMEVKKVWDIQIEGYVIYVNKELFSLSETSENAFKLANNDGLDIVNFWSWFPYKPGKIFKGQIIAWDSKIEYI